ncbi:MAG: prepilin-type N-terminal cleavage/methylation domain-containing protein [Candidatus Omnitrophica bacterium]|nr:prepilin-type N-terminal cleavage/methylation domain-containing protein [Candidatus Omnitrophota bacterium]
MKKTRCRTFTLIELIIIIAIIAILALILKPQAFLSLEMAHMGQITP